jgi:predicted RNA polymerase sigma factor
VSYPAGPGAGLAIVDAVLGAGRLEDSPHLHAVRGDLLERAGRHTESVEAFERAAALTRSDAERSIFTARAAAARSRS